MAEAIVDDGSTEELTVQTLDDGTVVFADWGSDAQDGGEHFSGGGSQASILDNACSDGYYELNGGRWTITLRYRYKSGSAPADVGDSAARNHILLGGFNITSSRNNCGRADNVSATLSEEGTTTNGPNIGVNSNCTTNDNQNVVSFGDLASGHLAYACWWFTSQGHFIDTDIKFNKFDGVDWYTGIIPPDCFVLSRYNLQAVATHEFGHAFGLSHKNMSESAHEWLTMSPNIEGPCQDSEVTLGLGDMRGLEQHY